MVDHSVKHVGTIDGLVIATARWSRGAIVRTDCGRRELFPSVECLCQVFAERHVVEVERIGFVASREPLGEVL